MMSQISRGVARLALAVLSLTVLPTIGCGEKEVILKTADGVELSAADIDRQALALMPAGAAGIFRVDAPELFSSTTGSRWLQLMNGTLPVPKAAQFVPERDLKMLWLGLYSFQGVDLVGVASGDFNRQAIENAAAEAQVTPLGSPLVKVEYAGWQLFVSANVGFVVLTEQTVLFGNETGIRRALDRLEIGRVQVEVASEVERFLKQPGAPLAFASDSLQNPHVVALTREVPALDGIQLARVVGNFEPPGVNVAGTLTYADSGLAQAGAKGLHQMHQEIASVAWIGAAFGVANPIQRLEVRAAETSVQLSLALDGSALTSVSLQLNELLGVSR